MKLSSLASDVSMDVIRDGAFESLGLLSSPVASTLAALHDVSRAGDWQSNPSIACVITSENLASLVPDGVGLAIAPVPLETFLEAQRFLGTKTDFYGTSFATVIDSGATIHAGAHIAEENVRIDAGCIVEAGAVVLERVTLGAGTIVRAGAVTGAEGFYPVTYRGAQVNMPHYGGVTTGKRVEIGANSVACRSTFGPPTSLGDGTILGSQVYIAHGVKVGARCRIAAGARICGSTTLGDEVFVGPNAVISNLIDVGERATISIGSVVVRDVPAGGSVSGHFAIEHQKFLEIWTRIFR